MKSEEKISVIVPVYNIEKEVARCVVSLGFQKYQNYEIIIIDDGSTDGSALVIDELAKKNGKIKIFHTENHGLSAARNLGIEKATGKYISFVDGDDYVDPNYLSTLYEAIVENDADISVCGYTDITKKNITEEFPEKPVLTGKEAAIHLLTHQNNIEIVAWNKLYNKNLFKDIAFPIGEKFEDNLTTYKLLAGAKKVAFKKISAYNHVFRDSSIMGTSKTMQRLLIKIRAAEEAIEFFANDKELKLAAEYSLLLAYFQMIDYAARKEIDPKNFDIYSKKVLEKKDSFLNNPFCDKKRRGYIAALTPLSGFFYRTFRKF